MKQKILNISLFFLALVGFILIQSCEKTDCPACPETPELKTLFDTLKGEWTWIYSDSYAGSSQPDYPITVHFLSENNDLSINYVTFKHDTIKKYGRFTVLPHWRGREIDPDILVHYNKFWSLIFDFTSRDTIRFYESGDDVTYYYYKRIDQ